MATTERLHSSHVLIRHPLPAAVAGKAGARICPLCGSAETDTAFTDSGCELRVCNVCELFFVHPYPASGRQHQRVAAGEYAEIELLDCERRYQGERLYYDRHFPLIADEMQCATSVLDVGCGTGHLLERLADRPGLYRAGIELNPLAARIARCAAKCHVLGIPFEQFSGGRKFDVITMVNVLSHIPSFDGMFRAVRAALAPGGKVLLRTSEMSRNVSRWNQIHWGIPDDLHFLGLGTLDFICAKYGFVVTRHIRTPYEEELFLRSRWQQMGRNPFLNLAKRTVAHYPGILPLLKKLYTATLGQRLFVSFIVLRPISDPGSAFAGRRN
ncbi:MAG: class I SAM-dependent methyltransferase [Acidobacteriia bacterium]|nr:class I SAM-dependent methyltransferase [Terriglobia bacterium]